MNLRKISNYLKSLNDPALMRYSSPDCRTLLLHFYNTSQTNVRLLKNDVSESTIRQIREELDAYNVELGMPVKLHKPVEDMTFKDWLHVESELHKYEVLNTGIPRVNHNKLMQDVEQYGLPYQICQEVSGANWLKSGAISAITFICVTIGVVSCINIKEFGLIEYMLALTSLLIAAGSLTELAGKINFWLDRSDSKKINQVSDTWEDVFKVNKLEDVFLVQMLREFKKVGIRWGDLTPSEAMEICLKLAVPRNYDKFKKLKEEWVYDISESKNETTPVSDAIKVKVPEVPEVQAAPFNALIPNIDMNELASSFKEESPVESIQVSLTR